MPSQGRWEPPPPPSPTTSFRKLIASCKKNAPQEEAPSFVKKLDDVPEINLPSEQPMKVAISLSDQGLVGQFMGLWPSARTIDN
jgi:hypothetical protein